MAERKERKMRELDEDHKRKMEEMEKRHRIEIAELEKQTDELIKENMRSERKLNLQKEKQLKELKILQSKHEEERENKEKELKKNEEEHIEEVQKKLRDLKIAQEEIRTGRKTVKEVMKEEEVVYELITELFGINRLWLLVIDEMDQISEIGKIDSKTKGAFEVLATILSDMEDRKWDMNKYCTEKCLGAIRKNRQLIGGDTADKVLSILDMIGKPFSCLQELIRQARNQRWPDTERLKSEVEEIASLVRELEKIRIAPRRTVQMALDQENIRALAQ